MSHITWTDIIYQESESSARLAAFQERFGSQIGYLHLAACAAFLPVLTFDLLAKIAQNFPPSTPQKASGDYQIHQAFKSKVITIVADILLSALCEPLGQGMYEMYDNPKQILLRSLRLHKNFGEPFLDKLGLFLQKYGKECATTIPTSSLAEVFRFTALARINPKQAAAELLMTYEEGDQNRVELMQRLGTVVDSTKRETSYQDNPLRVAMSIVRGLELCKEGQESEGIELLRPFAKNLKAENLPAGIRIRIPYEVSYQLGFKDQNDELKSALAIIAEEKLKKSGTLDLSQHGLQQIPVELFELVHLERLELNDNDLQSIPFHHLSKLRRLKHLNLRNNKIEELDFGEDVLSIEWLDISNNNLSFLTISSLPSLKYLNANRNQLKSLNLSSSRTSIETISVIDNLLESLPFFTAVTNLRELYVFGNPLSEIPQEFCPKAEEVNIGDELKQYLKALDQSRISINTRAKVIIVGNGRVGKTSIFRRLANKPFDVNESFTHGIQLGVLTEEDLPEVKTDELHLQVWDFGGQEIFYGTHQFFLSDEAIYILAWTDHKNVALHRERDKERLPFDEKWRSCEYWLEAIRLRSSTSPILMVQTHSDIIQNRRPTDPAWERPPYNAISLDLSAAKDYGLAKLKSFLSDCLNTTIPMLGQEFPASYETIIQMVEQLRERQPSINYNHFFQLCQDAGIHEGGERTLLEYLVKSGFVVYFTKPLLREIIYIDPNWISQQVYLLINNELRVLKGRIDQAYIERIFHYPKYDNKKRGQFVELLKGFELIFAPRGESFYIAPQYLPEKLDHIEQRLHDIILRNLELAFVFRFPKFLPDNVMINFLSRYGPFSNDIYWKNGISFSNEIGAQCIVHLEEASRSLNVYCKMDRTSAMLQREICQAFVELSRNANAEISLDGKTFASWQEVEKYAKLSPANPMQQFFATDGTTPLLLEDFALFWDKEERQLMEDGRRRKEKEDNNFIQIREFIRKNDLRKAIKDLLEQDLVEDSRTEVLQLEQQLSALQKKVRGNTLYPNEENLERNKILQALLDLMSTIEVRETLTKPTPILASALISTPKIYFSYAWGDKEEKGVSHVEMVNKLYNSLTTDGFEVLRDNMSIEYGSLISEFMKELGKRDLIVVFVSEKYAKSPYCMFELYEIARNAKWDKSLFSDRILIIPLERIRFDDPEVLEEYFDYWVRQYNKWKKLMEKRVEHAASITYSRYEKTKAIAQKFGDLTDWLIDINSSTISLLSENDLQRIKEVIQKRLETR